ncbi:MAG: DUF1561 domain-containing protein, partial [Helicobacter sp.]|nr:DUF1561 domain-containing protein [Helicobacter sp.]
MLLLVALFACAHAEAPFLLPSNVVQKRADTPKDMPIRIQTHDRYSLCYTAQFSLGAEHRSYLGILN